MAQPERPPGAPPQPDPDPGITQVPSPTPFRGPGGGSGPALRDADAILARATADEADAAEARSRYRLEGIRPVRADGRIARLLDPGEQVLAVHPSVALDRREPVLDARRVRGLAGSLYLTNRRLVLVGRHVLNFDLAGIDDVVPLGEQLHVAMRDGTGITLDVEAPRLLRVQIAAARSALRG